MHFMIAFGENFDLFIKANDNKNEYLQFNL